MTIMGQLVTRIDDNLARAIDQLVEEGVFESRSEAVRKSLSATLDAHRRIRSHRVTAGTIGNQIGRYLSRSL